MAWNNSKNESRESAQRSNSFKEQTRQVSVEEGQLSRAVREISKISESITGNSKGFSSLFSSKATKNKRIPRQYRINNKQSILLIIQGDITRTKVDAIVNAANEHMTGGSGVDGIIHSNAGDELYEACKAHKEVRRGVRLPTGHSRILLSYNMSRTTYYIINTAGPVYRRHEAKKCAEELSSCYKTALALANLYDLESIGFTAISCGIYGYPANDGAEVALRTVDEEAGSVPVVVFVLWDDHIYDAWIKKAEELELVPFDPESSAPNVSTPQTHENQPTISSKPTTDNIEQGSQATFNPTVKDFSTTDATEKTPDKESENLLLKIPSVPDESSDTQPMDEDDNSTKDIARSHTVDMTSVDSEQHQSMMHVNSEQQSVQEETGKPNEGKPTPDNEPKTPLIQDTTDKSDNAKTEVNTNQEKKKRTIVSAAPEQED